MIDRKARVFVAGHNGMVGSAVLRKLQALGYENIVTKNKSGLDLADQDQVDCFFRSESIDIVYLAAAKVGGIHANNAYPAEFIQENLAIELNVIHAAHKHDVQKLLLLGSSCIYPRNTPQPIKEEFLLTGVLEPTNEPYAIAKIAGIKLCESYNRQYRRDYRSVMPTNLYGPGDNYHPENSHVVPALLKRFHQAKASSAEVVAIWGSGKPKREFLHVYDMADACIAVMELDYEVWKSSVDPMCSHLNVGTGKDCSILELATLVAQTVGFEGRIDLDDSKPDGIERKLLDVSKLNGLGWSSKITLEQGLKDLYLELKNRPVSQW